MHLIRSISISIHSSLASFRLNNLNSLFNDDCYSLLFIQKFQILSYITVMEVWLRYIYYLSLSNASVSILLLILTQDRSQRGRLGAERLPPLRTINCHFVGKFDLIKSRLNNKLMFFKQWFYCFAVNCWKFILSCPPVRRLLDSALY